jgi:DNA helicase-2/ATP-dependent DNA helicase PcrA
MSHLPRKTQGSRLSHEDLLIGLTPAQCDAVTTVNGALLILAGPGSGKTRVVTHRIAYMLREGIPARSILALTFTNKAADEMKRRLMLLAPGEQVWVGTFHRFCGSLLRRYAEQVGLGQNFTIYDSGDSLTLLKQVIKESNIELTHITPDRVHQAISWAKNSLVSAEQYEARPGHPLGQIVAKLYPLYQKHLLLANAVDFDDMLLHVANLLQQQPEIRASLDQRYRYILVDEYQDTNLAQYMIVRGLSIDYPNLSVTGDPDQSIYGWRGANLSNILDFEKDYPTVKIVRLEQNYRSTKRILRVADELIANNKKRKPKHLFTDNPEGSMVSLTRYQSHQHEAEAIAGTIVEGIRGGRNPRDFAVFYRMNALSRSVEYALRDRGVPYQLVRGVEFYQRREIKDILAYLQLLNNPRDAVAFRRIINTPVRGIGKTTIAAIEEYATAHNVSQLDAARQAGIIPGLTKRAAVGVAKFVALYDELGTHIDAPVEEIVGHVFSLTQYDAALRESSDADDLERLANLQELLTAGREFDEQHPNDGGLENFLEQACLTNDIDGWDTESDRVTLMTLHAAKGLEFPTVFLLGVEEGILPHERSSQSPDQLEEERRLLFVGITRAQQELYLSTAQTRGFRGSVRMTVPSIFLHELPKSELTIRDDTWSNEPGFEDGQHAAEAFESQIYRPQGEPVTPAAPLPTPEEMRKRWNLTTADRLASESFAPADENTTVPVIVIGEALLAQAKQELAALNKPPSTPRISPEAFIHGMVVMHPEYGVGKITALSGAGIRRMATVVFPGGSGEKKFMLVNSPLRPAGK